MPEAIISITIKALPEGVYLATSKDLPGLVVQGRTLAETLEFAQDVAAKLVESYVEHGEALPPALRVVPARRFNTKIAVSVP
ncbi:MAG: type II toxin-antitoxin system HicB family antitoxin [Chloroflexi bacterium]|nr:type II toxin-antitoxin system HicB family antitoxin [Chloroflexota bacterium]